MNHTLHFKFKKVPRLRLTVFSICALTALVYLSGCGRLWGGVTWYRSTSGNGLSFAGAIGKLTASTGTCPASGAAAGWCTGGTFGGGSGDGMFINIGNLVQTPNYLYITNSSNFNITRINAATGAFAGSIGFTTSSTGTCPVGATVNWCTGGTFTNNSTDNGFFNPIGIGVDSTNGFLYTADTVAQRVKKIDLTTGVHLGSIGRSTFAAGTCPAGAVPGWCTGSSFSSGAGDGMFNNPYSIAVDSVGDALYIADAFNHRVSKFTLSTGAYIGSIGNTVGTVGTCPAAGAAPSWCTGGTFSFGSGDGMFNFPTSVAIDTVHNYLYVAEASNWRIQRFDLSTGGVAGAIGRTTATTGTCPASGAAPGWCTGGTFATGTGDGMISFASGLFVNPSEGFLYYSDSNRIVKVNSTTGAFVGAFGKVTGSTGTCPSSGVTPNWCTGGVFASGTGDGMFSSATGLAYDSLNGFFYIGDSSRLQWLR